MARIKPTSRRRARELRRKMTDAECVLWRQLRGRQIRGAKFRHQHPVGRFIVDFACIEAALIVEVDGGQHAEQGPRDGARTAWLNRQGFRVLRFWNHEVLANPEGVTETIARALERGDCPPPNLPPACWGEGR